MKVFTFRLLISENEDFIRDIEIRSDQTFLDFHRMILSCTGLDGDELGSFHLCNKKWEKQKEITLMDMVTDAKKTRGKSDQNIDDLYVMENSILEDFIAGKDQHLLYEYDFLDLKTFFIKLVKSGKPTAGRDYPRCSFKKGNTEYDDIDNQNADELTSKLLKDFENLLDDQYDY